MEVKSIFLWKHLPRKLPRTLPWKLFSRKISRLFEETFQQRFDGSLHETFFRSYFQGGLDGSSWENFFYGSYCHVSYFHERLDGSFHESFHELHAETASRLRMLRRICPSNFRTFSGNGSRSSFRGSFHGSSFHGRLRGRRGYRTTSPSPYLREEDPSTDCSGIHNLWLTPMEEVRGISRTYSFVSKKFQTRTHGPMRTSFHGNFHIGCITCIAA